MEKYALFTYESLKKTKCREFVPSRDEIEALISRQKMTSTVYCHGGGSCKITINSHTTAGEVRSGDGQLWRRTSVSLQWQFQPVAVLALGSTSSVPARWEGTVAAVRARKAYRSLCPTPPGCSEEILSTTTVFTLQRITQQQRFCRKKCRTD